MIEHILLWAAVATNLGAAIYTILMSRRKLRAMDRLLHEMENTRAQMKEFTTR